MWEHPTPMQAIGKQYPGRVYERASVGNDQAGVFILFTHAEGDFCLERIGTTLNLRNDVANPAVGQWTHCWLYHQDDKALRSKALKELSESPDVFAFLR